MKKPTKTPKKKAGKKVPVKPARIVKKAAQKVKSVVARANDKTRRKEAGLNDARQMVQERRFEVRLLATQVTFAALSFKTEAFGKDGYVFEPQMSGLLVDSSAGGCSLVFMKANPLTAQIMREANCVVKIGQAPPRRANIRWVKSLDERLVNAGFAFP